jgi:hypothetical protein
MAECSVCGKTYEGHGNNAAPFPGRCVRLDMFVERDDF